jgi:DNA-binding MarR family transcriptional regulator
MATFNKFKKLRGILKELPGVVTHTEFDILIEIGYHQEQGAPLTLKQLLLLQIASPATVRRYLSRLVRRELIKKVEVVNDHRSVHLVLCEDTVHMLASKLAEIASHLEMAVHPKGHPLSHANVSDQD